VGRDELDVSDDKTIQINIDDLCWPLMSHYVTMLIALRADLMTTLHTKRTPVLKAHYTPRNLCMVAGAFIPPSSAPPAPQS
jgi:hypothetical protein